MVLVLCGVIAGCGAAAPAGTTAGRSIRAEPSRGDHRVASNVLRGDYAGSAACAPCHADVVAAWERSPMHRMTRLPDATNVEAPFDGREFRFKGDVARLETLSGVRVMRVDSAGFGAHRYRVTRVIGGRVREDFAGVEIGLDDAALAPIAHASAELILPVSYLIGRRAFRLKGYSVMVGDRPGMRAGGVWNRTCIFCHNTVPYLDDLLGALTGDKVTAGYQGEVVEQTLPAARRLQYRVRDPRALVGALDDELRFLGADTSTSASSSSASGAALRRTIAETRARFGPQHFVELGIGCEACHGGSREHVDDPRVHPTFEPRSAFLTAGAPGREVSAAEWQNRACARCHQVLFSRYPYTWEGGSRRDPAHAGGSHITSGEARDFLLGGCSGAMTCTACHDPHGADDRKKLARLATPQGNAVCTGCHRAFGPREALRAHAHHDPDGLGAACIGCHMPRKNMGLDYALTRYHRIGSPTDSARVERDRPLECALCHTDQTVAALVRDLGAWWGKNYDAAALQRLYGSASLEVNAIATTIDRGLPHEQAAAIGAAAERRDAFARPGIERQMASNPIPLVRYTARAALERITGHAVEDAADANGVGSAARSSSGHGRSEEDED